MSALGSLTLLLCATAVGSGMLSALVPQKRTRRILSFVLGMFLLVVLIRGIGAAVSEIKTFDVLELSQEISVDIDEDYQAAVAQQTADTLVEAIDELLRGEDIAADNIRIKLKISSEGRILIDRIDIYISEAYRSRKSDIRSIVAANLSKEPVINVQGQEVERDPDG